MVKRRSTFESLAFRLSAQAITSPSSRTGAELLFQVFADRYERGSLLITSNLAFSEWVQVFQRKRMTAALLDRLTHHCHIFEMNGESYLFKQSVQKGKPKKK